MRYATAAVLILSSIFLCGKELSAELPQRFFAKPQKITGPEFKYADARMWQYLRCGLAYLESPRPLDPPESIPPAYVHPDGRGFGAYGLSPEAYEDVQRAYAFFRDHSWETVLGSAQLYDLANQAFADLLLAHLQEYIPAGADRQTVFNVLHQAWNLGLSGFKKGRHVVSSRTRRAEEFLALSASSS